MLVRTGREAGPGNLVFPGGGGGQYVQRKDWDNNILWQFEYSSDSVRMHHDLTVLPNGNVLLIAWGTAPWRIPGPQGATRSVLASLALLANRSWR